MSATIEKNATDCRFDSVAQEAFLSLWRTYDKLRAIEDEMFERHDLSAQQYNALRLLRSRHPEPAPTLAVAARLISRAPDITRLLDKLERRGLVDRVRPTDNRRVVQVGITRRGLDLLRKLDAEVLDCHARQLGHLSQESLLSLIGLLRAARAPHEAAGSEWSE